MDFMFVPLLALLWLLFATPLTPFLLGDGIFYCCRSARAGFPPPHSLRRSIAAIAMPLTSVPLAYALFRICITRFLGGSWI